MKDKSKLLRKQNNKEKNRKTKVISFVLLTCMLCSLFAATVSAIVQQNPVYTEGGTVEGKVDALRDTVVTVPLRDGMYGE